MSRIRDGQSPLTDLSAKKVGCVRNGRGREGTYRSDSCSVVLTDYEAHIADTISV